MDIPDRHRAIRPGSASRSADGPRPRLRAPDGSVRPGRKVRWPKGSRPGLSRPKPKPKTPLFPVDKRPSRPFGRRKPFSKVLPRVPIGIPWARVAGPLFAAGLAWQFLNRTPSNDAVMAAGGWKKCCDLQSPLPLNGRNGPTGVAILGSEAAAGNYCHSLTLLCGTGGQTFNPDMTIPPMVHSGTSTWNRQVLHLGYAPPGGVRMTVLQSWARVTHRFNSPSWPEVVLPPPPEFTPFPEEEFPLPQWVDPYPLPFSPTPYPLAPPLTLPEIPNPEDPGLPGIVVGPRPIVERPDPTITGPSVPSIDWDPEGPIGPGDHPIAPPGPGTVEKKKRLTASQTRAWLEALVSSYTETDDKVAALYRGLPWKIRRWRGRDGVWRDRDANTKDRLARLYSEFDSFDVRKGIEEYLKQEATDMAWGTIGNLLKKRTMKNADDGIHWGSQGHGTQRYTKTWDDVYKKLKADAAKKNPTRYYTTSEYNTKTGEWERVRHVRPNTQIPWYRQQSNYPGKTTKKVPNKPGLTETRFYDRYYYAERATDRPKWRI